VTKTRTYTCTLSDYSIVKERPLRQQRVVIDAGASPPSISTDGGAPAARLARTAGAQIADLSAIMR